MASATVLQEFRRANRTGQGRGDIAAPEGQFDARRVAVILSWVGQQVADIVALFQDRSERVEAELSRLGVRFTVFPVNVPEGQRPCPRARVKAISR